MAGLTTKGSCHYVNVCAYMCIKTVIYIYIDIYGESTIMCINLFLFHLGMKDGGGPQTTASNSNEKLLQSI